MPRISVVMPVFNREAMVADCVDSILAQSFADFEFIIVDDGSSDGTSQVLDRYDDRRIVRAALPVNCGISTARNAGLALARGEFIALMDSDNVAMPDRLEVQAAFFDGHKEIDILGTGIVKLLGTQRKPQKQPADDAVIKAFLLYLNGSALANGTAMIRRAFLLDHAISYRNIPVDEDHGMWIDAMAAGAKFFNLDGCHLHSRRHDGNTTSETSPRWLSFQAGKTPLRAELLGRWFPDLSHDESRSLARFMEYGVNLEIEEIGLGLAAAAKVTRYRGNRFGASQSHINAIVTEACQRVRRVLNEVLKG